MFTDIDKQQFEKQNILLTTIEKQIVHFKKGFPFIILDRPATDDDGIKAFTEKEVHFFASFFETIVKKIDIVKFVPASGAASRMFKHLFEFRDKFKGTEENIRTYFADAGFNSVFNFIDQIENFAFYQDLETVMASAGLDLKKNIKDGNLVPVISFLLDDNGLGYANLPKGLLKFHRYGNYSRTSLEEHLVEGANYCKNNDNTVKVHFTVSPEHRKKFEVKVAEVKNTYETMFHCQLEVSFSEQKTSTDTISVDMNNEPFRESDGSLLFRPGGHGALIENLNDLDGDLIFIKNIDNIVPDRLKAPTFLYKKALAGYLLQLQEKAFEYLEILDDGNVNEDELVCMALFARKDLNIDLCDAFAEMEFTEKIDYLYTMFNRPMRVCGMVKNEGEPGGGPFWVKNSAGEVSLQIVESSQIDLQNPIQKQIVDKATHFNPVDMVCCIKDFRGKKFNLPDFVDPETGFISIKSKDGRNLKAQELPGLWNGAMADWVTIFVETPIITFNPVKTVNDLLRKEHQEIN
ncbi:MAG: DUF4301 family protein [Lentimicrobiaceae bacterium]|nr:DUF4301 family protein [Lentimicrobiaceae bacterium]